MTKKIFLAIDNTNIYWCEEKVELLKSHIYGIKLGLEFYFHNGNDGVARLSRFNLPIFLDLKLNDIPTTVSKSLDVIKYLNPAFISIHCNAGAHTLNAAKECLTNTNIKLLGVTVLTSNVCQTKDVVKNVELALECKLDGIICSANENEFLRKRFKDKNFVIVNPGIRLKDDQNDDQKRTSTPENAIKTGADYIVMGRSILQSSEPLNVITLINERLINV